MNLNQFTEFETKYKITPDLLDTFKGLMEKQDAPHKFTYVESDDIYYFKDNESFLRHRFSENNNSKLVQLTCKKKTVNNNNFIRTEINIDLKDNNNQIEEVKNFSMIYGDANKTFRIRKYCHIYDFKNVTMVFYSVKNKKGLSHFLEIEVDEEKIPNLTEDQAWDIIKSWEKVLEPLGIKAQNRLRLSLFEMNVDTAEEINVKNNEIENGNVQTDGRTNEV